MKNPDGTEGTMLLPLLLPHKVLEYLITCCKLKLADGPIQAWWDHLEAVQDPFALETKDFRRAVPEVVWPMAIFGDEADMALQNDPDSGIYGIFLSLPFFRPKSPRNTRFLLFSLEASRLMKNPYESFYPVLEKIVQSMNLATEQGCAGRRFLCTEIRGDQVWIRILFRHISWWKATQVCFRCRATTKPTCMNYLIYSSNTGWETTRRSTAAFILEELPNPICASEKKRKKRKR